MENNRQASLLLIEDSAALRQAIKTMAEQMGLFTDIHCAADGLEGFKLLRQHRFDIVLCDLHMPRCTGMQFLKLQQQSPTTAEIPVIMLSSSDDADSRVRALEAGASDYLCKPAHRQEMRARLSIHLRLKQLRDDLQHKTDELERLSRTDTLTGVANRRRLDQALAQEYDRTRRYRRPLSVLMLDLDHFKALNDEHGHQAGDFALRAVADIIRAQVRRVDLVARYGGEEFVVVMPETSAEGARIAAERIRKAIEDAGLVWAGRELPLTVSIGVASPSVRAATAQRLLGAADAALYEAKGSGRNRVTMASATDEVVFRDDRRAPVSNA